jgi:tetratricopeptide (TPR) repeat protein
MKFKDHLKDFLTSFIPWTLVITWWRLLTKFRPLMDQVSRGDFKKIARPIPFLIGGLAFAFAVQSTFATKTWYPAFFELSSLERLEFMNVFEFDLSQLDSSIWSDNKLFPDRLSPVSKKIRSKVGSVELVEVSDFLKKNGNATLSNALKRASLVASKKRSPSKTELGAILILSLFITIWLPRFILHTPHSPPGITLSTFNYLFGFWIPINIMLSLLINYFRLQQVLSGTILTVFTTSIVGVVTVLQICHMCKVMAYSHRASYRRSGLALLIWVVAIVAVFRIETTLYVKIKGGIKRLVVPELSRKELRAKFADNDLESLAKSVELYKYKNRQDPQDLRCKTNLGKAYGRYANAFVTHEKYDEALAQLENAACVFEQLVIDEPKEPQYRLILSLIHKDTSEIFLKKGELIAALQAAKGAMTIAQPLLSSEPENPEWHAKITSIQLTIGDIELKQGNIEKALHSYLKASQTAAIFENKYGNKKHKWRFLAGNCHEKLANLFFQRRQYNRALERLELALSIYEPLSAEMPHKIDYFKAPAIIYYRIADICLEKKEDDKALEILQSAKRIHLELVKRNPAESTWKANLAFDFCKIGEVFIKKGIYDSALEAFISASSILQPFIREPYTNLIFLERAARVHRGMAYVYSRTRNWNSALEASKVELLIRLESVKQKPNDTNLRFRLASAYVKAADILLSMQKADRALASLEKSLKIHKELALHNPTDFFVVGAERIAHEKIGHFYAKVGKTDYALAAFSKALQICQDLSGHDTKPFLWRHETVRYSIIIADLLEKNGQPQDALSILHSAIKGHGNLNEDKHCDADCQTNIAKCYMLIANTDLKSKKYSEALQGFEIALSLSEPYARRGVMSANIVEAISLFGMAKACNVLEDNDKALKAYSDAREKIHSLISKFPTNIAYNYELLVPKISTDIGEIQMKRGAIKSAIKSFKYAIKDWEFIAKERPKDIAVLNELGWTRILLGKAHAEFGNVNMARVEWLKGRKLLEPMIGNINDKAVLDTYVKACLLSGSLEQARPIVERLLVLGWDDNDGLALAKRKGLLDKD